MFPFSYIHAPKFYNSISAACHKGFTYSWNSTFGLKLAKFYSRLLWHFEGAEINVTILFGQALLDAVVIYTPHENITWSRACNYKTVVIHHQSFKFFVAFYPWSVIVWSQFNSVKTFLDGTLSRCRTRKRWFVVLSWWATDSVCFFFRCSSDCLRCWIRLTRFVPTTYLCKIVKSYGTIIRTRKQELLNWLSLSMALIRCSWVLLCVKCNLGRARAEELDHVNEFRMVCQSLDKFSSS